MKWATLAACAASGIFRQAVLALTPAEWRSQSVYFLLTDRFGRTDNSTTASCDTSRRVSRHLSWPSFTLTSQPNYAGVQAYCGGSFQGIINHLDYIQNMGFTAIWITPVTNQFHEETGDGTSYHGYWQQNIYEINPNYGTASDLKALSDALHARNMYLMVDVVANHMGYDGSGTSVNYSVFYPFDSQSYFHTYCPISNYDDQDNVEDCWLGDSMVALADLNTTEPTVKILWYAWVASLVSNYSNTAKHVQKDFWPGYNNAAGVYCIGEVFDGDPAYTCAYQEYLDGILNYPIYYPLLYAFRSTSGSISSLYEMISSVATACIDPTLLGNFIENHDNARFASFTNDPSLAKNALAFMFFSDGIPIVYAGQEQHYSGGNDPANREATWLSGYDTTAELWITAANTPFYQDSNTLAMLKGSAAGRQVVVVLSNLGDSSSSYTLTLSNMGYAAGTALVDAYTCTAITVSSSGSVAVPINSGLPRVLIPADWSIDLCGTSTSTAPSTTIAATAAMASKSVSCAATRPVTFMELVATSYGETIYLVGSVSQLGNWATSGAVALSAANYTASNPLWYTTVTLSVGLSLQYKYIKKEPDGGIVWESDPNRIVAVSSNCASELIISNAWR